MARKDYSWRRMVPQLETTPAAMDAIIVAAQMDGCWQELTRDQGVTRVDGNTSSTKGMSMLMTWLATGEEKLAWERLLELAEKITYHYDENSPVKSKRKG